MVKMENNIYAVPRTTFQWLDDTSVVLKSIDGRKFESGHCVLLDTVRLLLMYFDPINLENYSESKD